MSLDLRGKKLSLKEIDDLVKKLSRSDCTIDAVLLSDCGINDEGAVRLAKMVDKNKSVKRLLLSNNQIGDKGCAALADALQQNVALENVSLYNNVITDDGLMHFASSLPHNKTLKHLNVGENRVTDVSAAPLAMILSETNLHSVYLYDNNVSETLLKEINDALLLRRLTDDAHDELINKATASKEETVSIVNYLMALAVGIAITLALNIGAEYVDLSSYLSPDAVEAVKLVISVSMPLVAMIHISISRADTTGVMTSSSILLIFIFIWFIAKLDSNLRFAARTASLAGMGTVALRVLNSHLKEHLQKTRAKMNTAATTAAANNKDKKQQ